jgi:hypothetical protein
MSRYLSINIAIEFFCFFTALFCLWNDKNSVWRFSILYLFIVCCLEEAGHFFKTAHDQNSNILLYNILLIFEISYTSLIYYIVINRYAKSKPVILSGLVIICITYVAEISNHGYTNFNNFTLNVFSVLNVIYGFVFYYLLLKAPDYINVKTSAEFWWVTGSVFFYFGSMVSNLFIAIVHNINPLLSFNYYIYIAINVLLYSFWSFSFLCRYRLRK